jgi:phosphatidylserine/phosphatidylglycerophosphate/cardiolipin synthase-like enzyme
VIELRLLRDGGQTALAVAEDVGTFLDGARETLDLALYDLRLHDAEAERVRGALVGAMQRGVRVRLLYNLDHPGPIPVPPPPEAVSDLIESLPFETRAVSGVPDLMHHKYVVRDGSAVLSGSTNWTTDSWTRQENVILTVVSEELATAFTLNFEELWDDGDVEKSGRVEPRPVQVGGAEARPWFCPDHGEPLAHRIAKHIGKAKRRVRIASPVLTSGPILGTLAEVSAEKRCGLAGVVDETQLDEVYHQWLTNGVSAWKVPLLRSVIEQADFTGKPSTPWSPESVHDYMHAKVVVADDVSFVGSFNLSRSGERNAENVIELHDAETADRLAEYVDEIRALYPRSSVPFEAAAQPPAEAEEGKGSREAGTSPERTRAPVGPLPPPSGP